MVHCSEERFNIQIKNGLFGILFQTGDEVRSEAPVSNTA